MARSYLFEDLSSEQLAPLAATAATRTLVRGEYTWHVADPAEEVYVVLSGEVKDFVLDVEGRETVHLVHGPGMTFGEPGYFAVERNRSVANVATMPTALIRLDRPNLSRCMQEHPVVKDRALEGLAGMIRAAGIVMASRDTRPLADRLILRLLDLVDASPERIAGLAGAVGRVGTAMSSFSGRAAGYTYNLIGTWTDPAEDATHIAAVRDASAALAPLSLANAYVNFEAETDADRARAAYRPEIYDRLARLKRQYDPTNLFSRNQNVKPAP
ncbi:MAG: hypothetical protein QOG01_852 [Pseudonocardiales bacterium]|nr:hypothetical protein [Pseudonocardiales bacterium]